MGSICNGSKSIQQYQVSHLPLKREELAGCMKRTAVSERFRGEVEKLKLDGENMYKLILTVQGEREQSRSVEMKFMFSYADMQISPQYKFTLQDMTHFPIFDPFQIVQQQSSQSIISNAQVYHKIRTAQKRKRTMKYYNFRSLNDYEFKRGLYEISLYKRLQQQQQNMLQDYFVIYKGEIKQLVMIFNYSYVTLHDMLYYRKMASYDWQEIELLMLMNMLCENLIELNRVNIVHRDIRPGKVFFSPLANVGNPPENRNGSNQCSRFYHLMNLQSARVYEKGYNSGGLVQGEMNMKDNLIDDDIDLLTVKGVPTFTDTPVRQALQRDEHKANYNPHENDINSLKHTLKSLINLQPNNITALNEEKIKSKPRIKQLLKYIYQPHITIQQLNDKVLLLMGIVTFSKPASYFSMMRDFYIKELTLAQNIQMNLYFNNGSSGELLGYDQKATSKVGSSLINSSQSGIKTEGLTTTNSIQLKLSSLSGKQYAQDLYIKGLYDLHKKDIFVPFMLQKLSKNFQLNKKQQNVSLLMKVGRYFEEAGIKQNQYYKEAIILLLELAQQERLQGFYKDHQRLITYAQEVFSKFSIDSKMIIRAKCILFKEKAYRELYSFSNNNNSNNNINNFPYYSPQMLLNNMMMMTERSSNYNQQYQKQLSNKNSNSPIVQSLINQAYELAMKSNLSFEEQLELIYSKGELYVLMGRVEESEALYLTGYQLIEKNYKEFMTVHNCTKYKAIFQYGLAMVDLLRLRTRTIQKSPKILFSLQNKLNTAKERFTSISIHPIYVIRCYMTIGDLFLLKQNPRQALGSYEKGLNLLQAENSQSEERRISSEVELSIVERIVDVCGRVSGGMSVGMGNNNMNMNGDMQRYQLLYEGLKRELNKERKSQKKYSRKGKMTTGNSNKQTSMINTNNRQNIGYNTNINYQQSLLLPVISQQQQQNKMFESQKIFIKDNNNLLSQQQPSYAYNYDYGVKNQRERQRPSMNRYSKQSAIDINLGYEEEHLY